MLNETFSVIFKHGACYVVSRNGKVKLVSNFPSYQQKSTAKQLCGWNEIWPVLNANSATYVPT